MEIEETWNHARTAALFRKASTRAGRTITIEFAKAELALEDMNWTWLGSVA
jgi:hypothetical protein